MCEEDFKKVQFENLSQIGAFSICKQIQKKPVSYYEEKQKRLVQEMDELYEVFTKKELELNHSIVELYVRRYLDFLDYCLKQGFDLNKVHGWVPEKDSYPTRGVMLNEFERYVNKEENKDNGC